MVMNEKALFKSQSSVLMFFMRFSGRKMAGVRQRVNRSTAFCCNEYGCDVTGFFLPLPESEVELRSRASCVTLGRFTALDRAWTYGEFVHENAQNVPPLAAGFFTVADVSRPLDPIHSREEQTHD